MAYFDLDDIKFDLNIKGTTFDSQITNTWGPEADEEVDNRIYTAASKARRITALPILPLATTPTTIKSASDHFVKERYYKRTRNTDKQKEERQAAVDSINAYVARLNVDTVWYGRLTGS